MTQYFTIHPENPQKRLIRQVNDTLNDGGVVAFPTDAAYALGCALGHKSATERIRRIRQLTERHHFTLMCRDFSELGHYARVDNPTFRLLKANTPGPYTFILKATKEVPRRLVQAKKKTIGLRIPDNLIVQHLLETHGAPIMSVTLILPEETDPLTDPQLIYDQLKGQVAIVIDGGPGDLQPSTVIDLTEDTPNVIREGKGDPSPFYS